MRFTIIAAFTALAACASPSTNQTTGTNASGKQEIMVACDAGPANFALGQPYSAELAERARIASGALTVRRLAPEQVVTMEHLESRLSLEVDAGNRVTGVVCGS